jgi:Co/Zn/Cd efflux system component
VGKERVKRWQLARTRQRKFLWIAFSVTDAMLLFEIIAGLYAMSASLQVDALETADSKSIVDTIMTKRISPRRDAQVSMISCAFSVLLCLWVAAVGIWNYVHANVPDYTVMAIVAAAALTVNASILVMVRNDRFGNASMKAAWIGARNNVIGNLGVLAGAAGVYATGQSWPDSLIAATILPFAIYRMMITFRTARSTLRDLERMEKEVPQRAKRRSRHPK